MFQAPGEALCDISLVASNVRDPGNFIHSRILICSPTKKQTRHHDENDGSFSAQTAPWRMKPTQDTATQSWWNYWCSIHAHTTINQTKNWIFRSKMHVTTMMKRRWRCHFRPQRDSLLQKSQYLTINRHNIGGLLCWCGSEEPTAVVMCFNGTWAMSI